jgi:hypothetical protein
MEGERGRGKETKGEGREGERSAGDRTHFNPTLISFSLSPPPPPPGGGGGGGTHLPPPPSFSATRHLEGRVCASSPEASHPASEVLIRDPGVGRPDDTVGRRRVLVPEGGRQLGRMFLHAFWRPAFERRQ